MSMSAPAPPDPVATAQAQEGVNVQSAVDQQAINNVNQTTPYGSLNYVQTGTNSQGVPIYSANTTLNAPEQQLFNTDVGTQNTMASDANKLAGNLGNSLTSAPDLGNQALLSQMMKWQQQSMQPTWNIQDSNLNSQLAALGISQGSQAWNNAQMGNTQGQSNSMEQALANDEPLAYQQAAESYQLPIQTLGTLLGEAQPGSVSSSLTAPPQEQIQPANEEALVQQDYQSQVQNYQNTMAGIFGLGDAIVGAGGKWAASDERLKDDIQEVGELHDGTPIYRYKFKGSDTYQIGTLAQELVKTHPEAVKKGMGGMLMVDYKTATQDSVGNNHD